MRTGVWNSPEVITGCSQQDAMGFNVSPLHHQDYIEEDAAVPKSQQPPEQGLGMLCTSVGVVDTVWGRGLRGQLAQLGELLLLCHSDHRTTPHHLGRQLARQRGWGMSQGGNTPRTTDQLCSQWHLLLTELLVPPSS